LLATGFNSAGGPEHYTCASKGTNQNWCYVSVEINDDQFNNQGPWSRFKQEIIAFQLVSPYTVRRLAHHRSRQLNCPSCAFGGYEYSPRPSASWDGLKVAWASNFDYNGSPAEYADIYVIETPQLAESTPLVSPSYQLAMADLTNGNTSVGLVAPIPSLSLQGVSGTPIPAGHLDRVAEWERVYAADLRQGRWKPQKTETRYEAASSTGFASTSMTRLSRWVVDRGWPVSNGGKSG